MNSKKICKAFFLCLYYGVFRYLPLSYSKPLGGVSSRLRLWACKHIFESCGKNVTIERMTYFGKGDKIRIGDNSGLGENCKIPNGSHIGKDVMMGPQCYFIQPNHRFERKDIPMRMQGYCRPLPVTIEDDCWIGHGVIATAGRKISKGSIIAAACVLTKDFPEYSIVGGNPGQLIKTR